MKITVSSMLKIQPNENPDTSEIKPEITATIKVGIANTAEITEAIKAA